jgi:hypothetical protein
MRGVSPSDRRKAQSYEMGIYCAAQQATQNNTATQLDMIPYANALKRGSCVRKTVLICAACFG